MSRDVRDIICDISEMLDTVENECINLIEDRDYLQRELKEFKEQGKEFPKAYDLGYEEGFEKGEQSMQDKANKIIEFYRDNNGDIDVLQTVFSEQSIFGDQILEDIETAYNKIIEYEKEKEQEAEIHVGDVVEDIGGVKTLLVTNVVSPYVYTLDRDGRDGVRNKNDVVKTCEHYPLDEFLRGLK